MPQKKSESTPEYESASAVAYAPYAAPSVSTISRCTASS